MTRAKWWLLGLVALAVITGFGVRSAWAADVPSGVVVDDSFDGGFAVSWQAVTGASGYDVRVDGAGVYRVDSPAFTLTGLDGWSSHTVEVASVDGTSGDDSAFSAPITVQVRGWGYPLAYLALFVMLFAAGGAAAGLFRLVLR